MQTILLATDGSPSSENATDEAIDLATATGRTLRVVTVWNMPIVSGYGYAPYPLPRELADAEREHAHDVAAAAVAKAADAGIDATFELRTGLPAEEICAAAEESAASLIVIGAHGWGPVRRFLFGSVSTHVMHAAPCPVLVVRTEETEITDSERAAIAGAVGR
jgi:nucleotide-binding universal stress UspA family protein